MVKKYDSISPVLANLRWLPVFFISVYKSLNNLAPLYLTNLLWALRSENYKLLVVPMTIRHHKGDSFFSNGAEIVEWVAATYQVS